MLNLDINTNIKEFNSFTYTGSINTFVLQNKRLHFEYVIPHVYSNKFIEERDLINLTKESASIEFSKLILDNMVSSIHVNIENQKVVRYSVNVLTEVERDKYDNIIKSKDNIISQQLDLIQKDQVKLNEINNIKSSFINRLKFLFGIK